MADSNVLKIRHLSKTFGTNVVLRDIDFNVNAKDVTCIIGASGSGKSTLLRCINLLETPTTGEILYHDVDITDRKMNVPEYRTRVGMVFQNFNLFNNMTVLENCMVGQVKVLKKDREEARRKAMMFFREGWNGALYQCQAKTAFRWSEAEGSHCKSTCHGTGDSSF